MENNQPIIDSETAKKLFQQETEPSQELKSEKPENLEEVNLNPSKQANTPSSRLADYPNPPREHMAWRTYGFWALIIVGAFILGFCIVNGPAIVKKVGFIFKKDQKYSNILTPEVNVSEVSAKTTNESVPNNRLVIPKINVDAPIIWNVEESQTKEKLLEGIVHYKNTALPNQEGGNAFLTGHSSNYWWIKSDYNDVLALLPKLQTGDKIVITYENIKYVYEVYDKITVSPKQIEVTNPVDNESIVSIMSCVPIGTNFKRLIVRGRLIYADESTSKSEKPVSSPNAQTSTTTSSDGEKPVEVKKETPASSTGGSTQQQPSSDLFLPTAP